MQFWCWAFVWIWNGKKSPLHQKKNKKKNVLFLSTFWQTTLLQGFVLFWPLMVSVEKWFLFYITMFFCNSLDRWTLFSLPWAIMGYYQLFHVGCQSASITFKLSHSTLAGLRIAVYHGTIILYLWSPFVCCTLQSLQQRSCCKKQHQPESRPKEVLYIPEVLLWCLEGDSSV